MSDLVSLSKEGEIGIITIDNPPVNALSPGIPEGILAALRRAEEEGLEIERELFEDRLHSDQAKALIRVFFGEREMTKMSGHPKDTRRSAIRKVGIVGAGTMGCGIATACSNAGIAVALKDVSPNVLDRGIAAIRKNYDASVSKGKCLSKWIWLSSSSRRADVVCGYNRPEACLRVDPQI